MLKYEKIIRNLSLAERIELLLTNNMYRNSTIDDFELPLYTISKNNKEAFFNNDYPSNNALASTWNLDLIKRASAEIALHAKENIVLGVNGYFVNKDTDPYFNGYVASSYINGINSSNATSSLCELPEMLVNDLDELRDIHLLPFEIAVRKANPTIICSNAVDNLDALIKDWKASGFVVTEVNNEEQLVEAFFKGSNVIYTELDAKEILLSAVKAYIEAKDKCIHNELSKEEFDELELGFKILNPQKIDELLDSYLDGLAKIDASQFEKPSFNESIFKNVGDESIALLKNDGVLPLDYTHNVAVLGQYARNPLVNDRFDNKYDDVIASIDNVDFSLSGFAYGYLDDNDSSELIEDAIKLIADSTAAIVYLGIPNDSDADTLPKSQLRLIDVLSERGIKIIAVITSNKPINMDFTDKCNAVLYSKPLSSAGIKSSIEIIGGKVIPSGRLIEYMPISSDIKINIGDPETYKYSFGHGLTYSIIDYKNFAIDRYGVELTLQNNGAYDAYDTVQMYIEYQSAEGKLRSLRGFKKVFLKAGESIRVKLEFDDLTFRSYFADKKCYGIKGGKYNVLIGRAYDQIEHKFVISLEESYNKVNVDNEIIADNEDYEELKKFVNEADITKYPKEDRGLSFKKKLIISIVISVYFNLMLLAILIPIGINSGITESFILVAALLGIYDIGYTIYLAVICANRKKINYTNTNDELTKYVEKMESFEALATRTYPIPVRQEALLDDEIQNEEEEIIEEIIEEEEIPSEEEEIFIEEEKPVYNISDEFNIEYEEIEFNNNIHYEDYVKGFIDYALNNGLIIEPKSARMLFSALAASQLVFIRSSSFELLPVLTELLIDYLGTKPYEFSLEGINNFDDLMWEKNDDESYSYTEFVEFMHYATKYKNNIALAALNDINIDTLVESLGVFFKYILNPNDNHIINLGTDDEPIDFIIPRNIKMIAICTDNDLENMPKAVALSTLSVELNLRANTITSDEEIEISYLSYSKLNQIIREAKERFYLPEEAWKKLDDFEESINDMEAFRYENKSILIYEKFISMLMEVGCEQDEVIDYLYASGIIPCLKSTQLYKSSKGDSTIYTIIEKLYGEDATPMTKRAIRKPE